METKSQISNKNISNKVPERKLDSSKVKLAVVGFVFIVALGLFIILYLLKDNSNITQSSSNGTIQSISGNAPFDDNFNRFSTRDYCGKPKLQPELITKRIVGGLEAKRHTWPWQIAVIKFKDFGGGTYSIKHLCGGTLVSPKNVITATHCFLNKKRNGITSDTTKYRILVGAHDKAQLTDGAKLAQIRKIVHHPRNNLATFGSISGVPINDISVLQLDDYIDPQHSVPIASFACLPEPYHVIVSGKRCWTSGWGLTKGTGFDKVLKQASQTIISQSSCNIYYKNLINEKVHVCTMENEMGTCQGDSGGPLVCQDDNDQWVLHGVVSFGPQHCSQYPSVFSPVTNYIPWICCFLEDYGPCSTIECSEQ